MTKGATAEVEAACLVLREGDALPELRAAACARVETCLGALQAIAANQAKMVNWWNQRLKPAMEDVERKEGDQDHALLDARLKRVGDITDRQGRALDRLMKAMDQAIVVARTLGMDVGESVGLPAGVKAEGAEDGKEVEVKGVSGKAKVYKFARSAGEVKAGDPASGSEAAKEA